MLLSIESWLKADDGNVAIVHCLTGRGRTATILAAVSNNYFKHISYKKAYNNILFHIKSYYVGQVKQDLMTQHQR